MIKNLTLEQIQNFTGKYPKQLRHVFLIEMWERFCFYGMCVVLIIFMEDQILGMKQLIWDTYNPNKIWYFIVGFWVVTIIALTVYDRLVIQPKEAKEL